MSTRPTHCPGAGQRPARELEVLATGAQTTVQDRGRPGLAALGVGRSGAADARSLDLANRLLGNPPEAAALEVTVGGLAVRARGGGGYVALTGADCPMSIDGRPVPSAAVVWLPDGAELRLGVPTAGLRSYLAVRGGIDVPSVLGSRATDTLAGLGPAPLRDGDRLPVGPTPAEAPHVDVAPVAPPTTGEITLRVVLGPRDEWFTDEAVQALTSTPFVVGSDSDRVGVRLTGASLARARDGEISSEGMVPGALQVPPSGEPVLFLADHPVTGGYPVVAVVRAADVPLAAQARPGQQIRFELTGGARDRRDP